MDLVNIPPLINGVEYSWGDIVATIGGVPILGIVAIDYGDDQDVVNVYGGGRFPVSYAKGRVTPTATITLLMSELPGLQAKSPTGRLQDIAPFNIDVTYLPEDGQVVQDSIRNCRFKKNSRSWKEGDTSQQVELELIPSHIKWHHI